MTTDPTITVYRDTPKAGETDAKFCGYRSSPQGHIVQQTAGHETAEDAYKALGGDGANEPK